MMLGLVSLMEGDYRVRSNRESGYGRFDICLAPNVHGRPGYIMEFKWERNVDEQALEKLANEALEQIDSKKYDTELRKIGADPITKIGIAFSGKKVKCLVDA